MWQGRKKHVYPTQNNNNLIFCILEDALKTVVLDEVTFQSSQSGLYISTIYLPHPTFPLTERNQGIGHLV